MPPHRPESEAPSAPGRPLLSAVPSWPVGVQLELEPSVATVMEGFSDNSSAFGETMPESSTNSASASRPQHGIEDGTATAPEAPGCRCAFCPLRLADPALLLRHYAEAHPEERPFACELCPERFRAAAGLAAHRDGHRQQGQQQDGPSNQDTERSSAKAYQGKSAHECGTCSKVFTKKSHLQTHVRVHTGEKPYQCKVCVKKFRNTNNLHYHSRTHTGEKPYECNVCRKKFYQKGDLNVHSRTHTGEKPYECKVCRKKFYRKGDLNVHSRTHTGETHFKCTVCSKHFSRRYNVLRHLKTHGTQKHVETSLSVTGEAVVEDQAVVGESSPQEPISPNLAAEDAHALVGELGAQHAAAGGQAPVAECGEGRPWRCSVCGQTFAELGGLVDHLHAHIAGTWLGGSATAEMAASPTGQHQCADCGKGLASLKSLKSHVRRHAVARRFECGRCLKSFNQEMDLDRHMRLHTGEKRFPCALCGRKFHRKDSRDRHVRRDHEGEAPSECSSLRDLPRSTRSGERPFKCSECSKCFYDRRDLLRHSRVHSGEKPFGCAVCGDKFGQKYRRDEHVRRSHVQK